MANCIGCLVELNHLDEDPDGGTHCVCAKCRAEEAHDFDKYPDTRFNRAGCVIVCKADEDS